MNQREVLIVKFIDEVSRKYKGETYVDYYFDESEGQFFIWHDNLWLDENSDEFNEFIGKAICKYFFDNNIYDIAFSYDHERSVSHKISKKINGIINGYSEQIKNVSSERPRFAMCNFNVKSRAVAYKIPENNVTQLTDNTNFHVKWGIHNGGLYNGHDETTGHFREKDSALLSIA